MDCKEAAKIIKAALRRRTGKHWSVTIKRGTSYGWITVTAPPSRCNYDWKGENPGTGHHPSLEDRQHLARLLGLESDFAHPQGVQIPAGSDYYQEYVDRAEGRKPTVLGKPYWD